MENQYKRQSLTFITNSPVLILLLLCALIIFPSKTKGNPISSEEHQAAERKYNLDLDRSYRRNKDLPLSPEIIENIKYKLSYIPKIRLYDLKFEESKRTSRIFLKLENMGDKALGSVIVRVFFQDTQGNILGQTNLSTIQSKYTHLAFRPNYIYETYSGITLKKTDIPSTWLETEEKLISAHVLYIEFFNENNVRKLSPEKQDYLDKVMVYDVAAQYNSSDKGIPAKLNFKLKNIGNRTLEHVTIKASYKNEFGKTIYEQKFEALPPGSYYRRPISKLLKPNYIIKVDENGRPPQEWDKQSVELKVVNLEFYSGPPQSDLSPEQKAYIKNLKIYDIETMPISNDEHIVTFKLKNTGTKTLQKIHLTIYFNDSSGTPIHDSMVTALADGDTQVSGRHRPHSLFKPNYIIEYRHNSKYESRGIKVSPPAEWDRGSIDIQVTSLSFHTSKFQVPILTASKLFYSNFVKVIGAKMPTPKKIKLTILNMGPLSLDKVGVRLYFKNGAGEIIHECLYYLDLSTKWRTFPVYGFSIWQAKDRQDLRFGSTHIPSEWDSTNSSSISYEIVDIGFSTSFFGIARTIIIFVVIVVFYWLLKPVKKNSSRREPTSKI